QGSSDEAALSVPATGTRQRGSSPLVRTGHDPNSDRARAARCGHRCCRQRSGVYVVGYGSEDGGDLLGFAVIRVLAAVVGVREAVEQLDQIFNEHGHLVCAFATGLRHSRRRFECPDLKSLRTSAAFGHAELYALSSPQYRASRRQGGRVHEDLTAVIAGEEAESLVGVIPLDLASRHVQTLCARRTGGLELAVHIQASGLGPAFIGVRIELARRDSNSTELDREAVR